MGVCLRKINYGESPTSFNPSMIRTENSTKTTTYFDSVLDNNCDIIADTFPIPNYVISDSSTVDHIIFSNGNNGVTTELFKIYNGGHTWPGSSFTNNNGISDGIRFKCLFISLLCLSV